MEKISKLSTTRISFNPSEERKWYPVYTNPRAEKKAAVLLSGKGIETYLPVQRQLKAWSDRKKWVVEPLIKSYLFVRISPQQQAEVLMTQGVCRFLYFSGKVATMPVQQIEQLKLLLATEAELEVCDHHFKTGETVFIKAGPLQGLTAEVVTYHSQRRLILRMDHVGRSILVQVSVVFTEPLN